MASFAANFTFKTDCPKCGGSKKLKTKVSLLAKDEIWVSGAKCYKCGHTLSSGIVADAAINVTWSPPVGE